MKHEFSAGIILYFKSHGTIEYLLIYSKATRYWGFPKGKIESGESKQEAAIREIKEETGLDASPTEGFEYPVTYFFRDKNKQLIKKVVYFFVGLAQSKQIKLSEEHDDFVWLPYDQALTQTSYANDRHALEQAAEFLKKS
jgi:8-oxo-dGTP pyrophosphatase MutT (NUDIX family)